MSNLTALADLVGRLGQECPWTKKQRTSDMLFYVRKECLEVEEVLRLKDASSTELMQELGDVLFDVLLMIEVTQRDHPEVTMQACCTSACDKLARRSPYLFGGPPATTVEEAQAAWQAGKQVEKSGKTLHAAGSASPPRPPPESQIASPSPRSRPVSSYPYSPQKPSGNPMSPGTSTSSIARPSRVPVRNPSRGSSPRSDPVIAEAGQAAPVSQGALPHRTTSDGQSEMPPMMVLPSAPKARVALSLDALDALDDMGADEQTASLHGAMYRGGGSGGDRHGGRVTAVRCDSPSDAHSVVHQRETETESADELNGLDEWERDFRRGAGPPSESESDDDDDDDH